MLSCPVQSCRRLFRRPCALARHVTCNHGESYEQVAEVGRGGGAEPSGASARPPRSGNTLRGSRAQTESDVAVDGVAADQLHPGFQSLLQRGASSESSSKFESDIQSNVLDQRNPQNQSHSEEAGTACMTTDDDDWQDLAGSDSSDGYDGVFPPGNTDDDDTGGAYFVADAANDEQLAPVRAENESAGGRVRPMVLPGGVSASLCRDVLDYYEGVLTGVTSKRVFHGSLGYFARAFDNRELGRVFTHVCTAGGVGLSRAQLIELYDVLRVTEEGAHGDRPFARRFKSRSAFVRAVRQEKRRTLASLGWREVALDLDGVDAKLIFRDGLEAIQHLVHKAHVIRWSPTDVWTSAEHSSKQFSMPNSSTGQSDVRGDVPPESYPSVLREYEAGSVTNGHFSVFTPLESYRGAEEQTHPQTQRQPCIHHDTETRPDHPSLPDPSRRYGRLDPAFTGAMDGTVFQDHLADIAASSDIPAGTRLLGIHAYSDSTVLSTSGGAFVSSGNDGLPALKRFAGSLYFATLRLSAWCSDFEPITTMKNVLTSTLIFVLNVTAVSAYPVRLRVLNIVSETASWVTVAYIPQVSQRFVTAPRKRAADARARLLQRVLYLVFGSCMRASHVGCRLRLGDGSEITVSPRLLLYVSDYIEERSVLCLKHHGGRYDCSSCMVASADAATVRGFGAPVRHVQATVSAQLEAARLFDAGQDAKRVKELEETHGLRPFVPALAGWAGLASGPCLLFVVPGFDRLHVVDLGVTRLLSNEVAMYAEWVFKDSGALAHGGYTPTMRSSNLRFRHACRVARVPKVYPGYWVNPGTLQPTLRGAEHRSAVHFLPLSVAGIMGSRVGPWRHAKITWSLCEYAALVRDLFGPACSVGGSARGIVNELCERLSFWVHNDFQMLFGPAQMPKLHKLMAHLLDEFVLRGNVQDADTGVNEALHKGVKKAWRLTNHRRQEYTLQLVLAEQLAAVNSSAQAMSAGQDSERHNNTGAPTRGRAYSASRLAAASGLDEVEHLLGCSADDDISVAGAAYVAGEVRWRQGRRKIVHASDDVCGAPWFDWVQYLGSDGVPLYGRARLVICAVRGRPTRTVVVERAMEVDGERNCAFTAYGCKRLRWVIGTSRCKPALHAVPLARVVDVLCVELDWEDWVLRHGLDAMPTAVPTSAEEVRDRRFFINVFANP